MTKWEQIELEGFVSCLKNGMYKNPYHICTHPTEKEYFSDGEEDANNFLSLIEKYKLTFDISIAGNNFKIENGKIG